MARTIRLLMPDGQARTMDVEEYIRGVVPAEILPDAHLEAMKAQAVIARSFALGWPRHQPRADVCTTPHCQMWRPSHDPRADQAVQATAGLVITYQGRVAVAFYHTCCGGRTRTARAVWGIDSAPWCQPVACICNEPARDHGVGLCHIGARKMAQNGATFEQILHHYYTGIQLAWNYGQSPQQREHVY